jgi:hypothetical protein
MTKQRDATLKKEKARKMEMTFVRHTAKPTKRGPAAFICTVQN